MYPNSALNVQPEINAKENLLKPSSSFNRLPENNDNLSVFLGNINNIRNQINGLSVELNLPEYFIDEAYIPEVLDMINLSNKESKLIIMMVNKNLDNILMLLKQLSCNKEQINQKDETISQMTKTINQKDETINQITAENKQQSRENRVLNFRREFGNALQVEDNKEETETAIFKAMSLLQEYIGADNFSLRAYDYKKKLLEPIVSNDYGTHETITLNSSDLHTNTALTAFLETCKSADCKELNIADRKPQIFKEADGRITVIFPIYSPKGYFKALLTLRYFNNEVDENKVAQDCEDYYKVFPEVNNRFLKGVNTLKLATLDGLTKINNRRSFDQELSRKINEADRYDRNLSLIIFDIDHFKNFNTVYGHLCGDEVLKAVAQMAKKTIRDSDFVARYGGEEFVIILPETNAQEAMETAERLRKNIETMEVDSHNDKGEPVKVKVASTFGVAQHSFGGSPNNLIELADQTLYKGKDSGRNRVMLHNQGGVMSYEEARQPVENISLGGNVIPQNILKTAPVRVDTAKVNA